MIYWAPLFHFYQPPTQTASMLMKISNEAYRPLLEVFSEFPYTHATVNINGVLTEMLGQCGYSDVLDKLRKYYYKTLVARHIFVQVTDSLYMD